MKKKNKKILIGILVLGVAVLLLNYFGIISLSSVFKSDSLSVYHGNPSNSQKVSNLFALGDNCVPDAGYDYCDEYSYSEYGMTAYAKIMLSDVKAEKRIANLIYYVGGAYQNVKGVGDKLYIATNLLFDEQFCNEYGCTGSTVTQLPSLSYKKIVAGPGQENTDCLTYTVWDSTTNGEYITWALTGYGWEGHGSCQTVRGVECYDETDCNAGMYCDKSSGLDGWANWKCKQKECSLNEEKCEGTTSYKCSPSTYSWVNNGKVIGKCNVECLQNNDCINFNNILNNVCGSSSDVIKVVSNGTCNLFTSKCSVVNSTQVVDECVFGCTSGQCFEDTSKFKVVIYIIGGLVILTSFIIFIKIRKRKR